MRVVLDANIIARATPGKSGPAAAVRKAIRNPHLLILSPFLLAELARVLRYDRVRKLHGLSDPEIDAFLSVLQTDALMVNVPVPATHAIVPSDPDDDPIVATAVDGKADFLCTLDKHLRRPEVKTYCAAHGVEIVTDVELLTIL